jgi:gamma-glutamyltranspeptidase/glutathione hydrolase
MRGAVCAPQSDAARAGTEILRAGGNACDAAVAAALAQGVCDPHRCGIGGFGVAQAYLRKANRSRIFSYHARAGAKVREDQWASRFLEASTDGFGFHVQDRVNDVGTGSIAAPGTIAGWELLHKQGGRLPWERVFEPAIRLAEEGFLVPDSLAQYWRRPGLFGRLSTLDRLKSTPRGATLALNSNGEPYAAGERMRQPALARTYRLLARRGADDFYRGELASIWQRELEEGGAFVTESDVRAYRAKEEAPAQMPYRGWTFYAPPPPAGGIPLLQCLRLLERVEIRRLEHNGPDYLETVGKVLRAVQAARPHTICDPAFGGMRSAELLSDDYLNGLTTDVPLRAKSAGESPDTTQICTIDEEGNAVSLSHSLGYGSGVFSSLGFLFNNAMSCFDPRPGRLESIAPGKSRYTAISTTLGFRDGRCRLVIGAPGGARITAALVETVLNLVDFDMPAQEAVSAPRFDCLGETFTFGSRIGEECRQALQKRGWGLHPSPKTHGHIGRVFLLWKDAEGNWRGGVDPAEEGLAEIV